MHLMNEEWYVRNTVLLILIHNQDQRRLRSVRPTVEAVTEKLKSSGSDVTAIEVAHQDWIYSIYRTRLALLRRKILVIYGTGLLLRRYRSSRRAQVGNLLRGIWQSLKILASRSSAENFLRRTRVETSLSHKHHLAWRLAVEYQASSCLVLEDDVIPSPTFDDLSGFAALMRRRSRLGVRLADSIADKETPLARLADVESGSCFLNQVVTNGTCAYWIDTSILKYWLRDCYLHPWILDLPADWLIESLEHFRLKGQAVKVLRNETGSFLVPAAKPLIHGSGCGVFVSEIQVPD